MGRMADPSGESVDPRLAAAIELLGRTGATSFQLRYSDDEQPVVWMAVAEYRDGRREAAGALTPEVAVFRLCYALIDGGTCTHCGRMSAFVPDADPLGILGQVTCAYQYDPELATFRRSCEGD